MASKQFTCAVRESDRLLVTATRDAVLFDLHAEGHSVGTVYLTVSQAMKLRKNLEGVIKEAAGVDG